MSEHMPEFGALLAARGFSVLGATLLAGIEGCPVSGDDLAKDGVK